MTRRFNTQLAAAFGQAALAIKLQPPCVSSGSEHFTPSHADADPDDSSPAPAADLSDLVNSFFERDYDRNNARKRTEKSRNKDFEKSKADKDEFDGESRMREAEETEHELKKLLNVDAHDEEGDREEREWIRSVTETALAASGVGERSSDGFKRRLMSRLRDAGFEAGLCKSRWEKTGNRCGGRHDYIDVKLGEKRYIVEVFLATEFELARPTAEFSALLRLIPQVFVGREEELKQVVRLMCGAVRRSMGAAEMKVPPWRRTLYMEAKWFGSYRRTVNKVPSNGEPETHPASRAVGFGPAPRGGAAVARGKVGLLQVSYLTTALAG